MYASLNRALLPHVLFWILIGAGWYLNELSYRLIAIAVALWLILVFGVSQMPAGIYWMTGLVALMDIGLVLKVIKHDIRI